jgi:hypothetical protein
MVSALEMILPQEVELGAHTGVVLLQQCKQRTFVWTHPTNRPWGYDLRPQCERCQVLKPWVVKKSDKLICVLTCGACGHTLRFNKPDKLVMLGKDSKAGWWGYTQQALEK